ncbi:MAG: class I SAM-dependent methyltransferase [Nocardioidaceae bacterium]
MRLWDEQVVPRLVDLALGNAEIHKLRARACRGLHGRVLEVGFGSGLNVEHYPTDVSSVSAVEPSAVAWSRAAPRIAASPVDVRREGLDAQRLALPDASHDAALSTFTLCTIPDVEAALADIRRVLRPGGRLHFAEHGLSPDPRVAGWQHRLAPVQHALAGGCHLDRPIADLLERAGFRTGALERFYAPGPKPLGYLYLGWAETV